MITGIIVTILFMQLDISFDECKFFFCQAIEAHGEHTDLEDRIDAFTRGDGNKKCNSTLLFFQIFIASFFFECFCSIVFSVYCYSLVALVS